MTRAASTGASPPHRKTAGASAPAVEQKAQIATACPFAAPAAGFRAPAPRAHHVVALANKAERWWRRASLVSRSSSLVDCRITPRNSTGARLPAATTRGETSGNETRRERISSATALQEFGRERCRALSLLSSLFRATGTELMTAPALAFLKTVLPSFLEAKAIA